MDKKLKYFLFKSIIILVLIHFAYFIYGYFTFEGIKNVDIYTEFYRFKFYDDVSISHFFVSGLFLLIFLVFLLRKHSKQCYGCGNIFKVSVILLLISFLTFTFFISYSFGLNAKLKTELSEANFNKDKTLLNVLNPFLYKYTSYSSEKLFNPENILYPKPYPVIMEIDTVFQNPEDKEYYSTEHNYYSIDTLKMLTKNYEKATTIKDSVLDILVFDKAELSERIISKKTIKDSTEIVYKGLEVNPNYDGDICMFIQNKELFSPVHSISVNRQKYKNAVSRYKLLYEFKQDSLLRSFQKLDTLFRKYYIETQINPKDLTKDAFYYKENSDEPLNAIRNTFDRKALTEKFITLDNLFYKPNYLHASIQPIFFAIVFIVWIVLSLFYMIWNFKNKKI